MPESLKYILAPVFRNRLIKNKEFLKYYNLLESRESLSHEKIQEYQFTQLKNILTHSYQNVPYYHELFDKVSFDPFSFSDFSQMEKIPFLTRSLIKDNFDKLISREEVKGGYYVGHTGGSSGLPLKFLLDFNSIYKENAFIYYYRKKADYRFSDKLATFRGIEFGDRLWMYSPMYNELIFSPFKLSRLTLEHYVTKINDYNPQYLNGYLSSIYFFAKLLEESQIKLDSNLKGIFLISETIDNEQRKFVERFFKVKSAIHYGHSERCVLAEGIKAHNYKFDPYYGFTELIKIEDNRYSIVGTGFLSLTMPLIRYKTDDICTHENGYYSVSGKWKGTDGLYGKNNEYFGQAALNFHSDIFKNVLNYQFVQTEKGKADLLIIVNRDFKESEIDLMQKKIAKKTKDIIDFKIRVVNSLLLTPSGKFKMFN